ncbi:MAG: class I SAM-dependent methyltransferase [Chloroflexota bacterium]
MSNENAIDETRSIVQKRIESGDAMGWFDVVYQRAQNDADAVPWACCEPRPAFANWLRNHPLDGTGKTACVIGCGLGDDAEALAACNFQVTAFDIAPTAVSWSKERFPETTVDYQVADLFDPPSAWHNHFDFVFECFTIQALPIHMREQTIQAVMNLVAPEGTLLVVTLGMPSDATPSDDRGGPPWPLLRAEIDLFLNGMSEVELGVTPPKEDGGRDMWVVEYKK